jgi:hypothetical protein
MGAQLHDLGAVAAVRPRLQIELHRADHALVRESDQQETPLGADGIDHAAPIGFSLGAAERQQEAERCAACDRVAEQIDQRLPLPAGVVRIELPDGDQRVGWTQVRRPSIG